jgi:hypothetical protein
VVDETDIGVCHIRVLRGVRMVLPKKGRRTDSNIRRLAIVLYFLIPRAPSFTFYTAQPFVVDNTTIAFSRTPTNFSFVGNLNLLGKLGFFDLHVADLFTNSS